MKNSKVPISIACGLLALTIQTRAQTSQTTYQVTFKGTIVTTNANGDIVSTKLSNRSFIQDAQAAIPGATNANSLSLVYVQNASSDPSAPGDFVEVIGGTNDTPIYTNLQFMYGGNFPQPLTNSSGTQIAIGAGIIPQPAVISDSLGWATINERTMTKRNVIMGSFNFTSLMSPGTNSSMRLYSGTFNVGKQLPTP